MIQEIGEILSEATQSVLPMLLPQPVEVKVGETKDWQPQAFPDPMVLVTTNFSEGPAGSAYFLLATKHASSIVDLLLGGEGNDDRSMNEEAVDALKEVMNQVLGVVASNLRDKYDSKFNFEQVEVHSLEAEMDLGLLLDDGDTSMVELHVTPEGLEAAVLMGCLPKATIESIEALVAGAGGDEAEAAAPEADAGGGDIDMSGLGEGNVMEPPDLGDLFGEKKDDEAPATAEKGAPVQLEGSANIDLILDIELPIVIRLGSTEMTLKEIMRLGPGAIIELNKAVDEPVELLVNNQTIAKGEVVVVEGNFAFRVTDVESRRERIESLT